MNDYPVVVFLGQPNSGKSTLFNYLAGNKAQTSNFPGTTVSHTHSLVNIEGRILSIIDLPGTYSLNPSDPAERVALTHLFKEKPDLIIHIVDASILSRSLELTLELLELEYPLVVALNMMDMAEKKGVVIDAEKLAARLGVPVVPTIAARGRGVRELLDAAFRCLDTKCLVKAPRWSADVEERVEALARSLPPDFPVVANRRFTAIKLLEAGDVFCVEILKDVQPACQIEVDRTKRELELKRGAPPYEVIAAERHHLSQKIFEESSRVLRGRRESWDQRLDGVLMHPLLGYLILLAVFFLFFFLIFRVGNPLETLLLKPFAVLKEALAESLGSGLSYHLAEGLLQGIGGGIAIVLPFFLPLLFLMAFLEDLGYLARAGFLLDTFMHRLGLHGKSVSPFILGFGCNVPAIAATRILESKRDRIITSLLIPFIPCSARTTIILALVAFYLGPIWALGFYLFNVLVVAIVGRVLSFCYQEPSPGLILEIPSLKWPSARGMASKVWLQLMSFLKFAWPVLILGSVALGALQALHGEKTINGILAPLVTGALGLPKELGVTLVFGFLRKELSLIMMLQALGVDYKNLLTVITREQILVFTVFVSFFIPCLSTFVALWKESGRRVAFLSAGLSITAAVILAWLTRVVF
jgi:ferrous iron transport protein B